jgi:ubiquinone/menaquinone biosynthesis C-methylase UbiE
MASPEEQRTSETLFGRGQRDNYATASNLAKRQGLFDFLDPTRSAGRPAIERLIWTGTERVLDAGCGNGLWMRTLSRRFGVRSLVGLDRSFGVLADARSALEPSMRTVLVAGDVQRLPFRDESFDVVMCLWMLYHVSDHRSALEEFRRVLRPGGSLLVTTNSNSPRPLDQVAGQAMAAVTGQPVRPWLPDLNFSAENAAAILGNVFDHVEEETIVSAFALPTAEPALAAIESTRGPVEASHADPLDWPALETAARDLIEEDIARHGTFRTEIVSVSLLARK